MNMMHEKMAKQSGIVEKEKALPGREQAYLPDQLHSVLGTALVAPFPEECQTAVFALGCFWGAERLFWKQKGVHTTAVGYVAGYTPNPTYEEVCTGLTGHTEAVLVVYKPSVIRFDELLVLFWESHDPTQGMRQGNDVGSQYRSGIYVNEETQQRAAIASAEQFQKVLGDAGKGDITTEVSEISRFYYAEEYHQQYLAKNPNGYCGLGGTGLRCNIGE